MKGIWQLFTSDLRRGTSNVMSVIVLCGLIVIPSVFTWFNVIASWEPFDNTKNLKVAVASVDEGFTSSLIPLNINIGSMVESNLRANDQLDWVITTKEDAIAGTTSGDYYAAMVLPENFSERMMNFYTAGSQRTEIEYYTNDKSNPLAPVITSEGADDLSAKINSEFTEELGEVALAIIDSLVTQLDDPDSQAALSRVETQVGAVSTQLRAAATTAEMFTSLIESTVPLVESASGLLGTVEDEFSSTTGKVQAGIGASNEAKRVVDTATQALSTAFSASNTRLNQLTAEVQSLFNEIDTQAGLGEQRIDELAVDVNTFVTRLSDLRNELITLSADPGIPAGTLDGVIDQLDAAINQGTTITDRLDTAVSKIAAGNADAQQLETQILADITAAQRSLAQAGTAYNADVKPVLDRLANTLASSANGIGSASSDLSRLNNITDSLETQLNRAATDTGLLAADLVTAADAFEKVQQELAAAIDSGDLSQIATIIGSNPATLATALAQPIGLDRIPIFPVVSFGAGMAPLYTVLSLWVGALLITVTLRVDPPKQAFAGGPQLQLHQQFLGRFGMWALLGLAQSSLVFLGNIFLVGLQPAHPALFILAGWLTSLVFTFVIYTLVVSFSDAGKALAVFLLVIQVSAAGGAYPLPLLPEWFQNVSPFLPATHSIDAVRSAMAGIYQGDFFISIGWLLAFILPMLLLGLALRKPLIGFNEKMEKNLRSTKLIN